MSLNFSVNPHTTSNVSLQVSFGSIVISILILVLQFRQQDIFIKKPDGDQTKINFKIFCAVTIIVVTIVTFSVLLTANSTETESISQSTDLEVNLIIITEGSVDQNQDMGESNDGSNHRRYEFPPLFLLNK